MQPEPNQSRSQAMEDDTDTNKDTSVLSTPRDRERFLLDQKEIWVSPAKLRFTDLGWIVPWWRCVDSS